MLKIYAYSKCSTCRKALEWLDKHDIAHETHDIVTAPPSRKELEALFKRSGFPIARFFNTSGESYRAGDFKTKLKTMTEAQALDALAKDGKLIKRPLVDAGKTVLVGFDEASFKQMEAGI